MEVLLDAMEMFPEPSRNGEHPHGNGQQLSQKETSQRTFPGSPPVHQCQICKRTYERADRLSRHLKSHENARRYQCQRCQKSFNRADLLRRHVATHDRHASLGAEHGSYRPIDRVTQACIACAAAKARCEDQKPCGRCRTKNITCEVTSSISQSSRIQWIAPTGDQGQRGSSTGIPLSPKEPTVIQAQSTLSGEQGVKSNDNGHHGFTNSFSVEASGTYTGRGSTNVSLEHDTDLILPPLETYTMDALHLDPNQIVFDNPVDDLHFFSYGTDFNNQNLDISFHDFRYNDGNMKIATGMHINPQVNESVMTKTTSPISRPTRDVLAGHAAFTRSPWLWTPAFKDRIFGDQEHLALDDNTTVSSLSPMSLGNVPSCGFPSLNSGDRDKMFYMVSTVDKYSNHIPEFPSLENLNNIVEAFFLRQSYQVDNWIHVASLSLSDVIPEFLIALVVAGSTVISVPAIWKLGLALQDVLRAKIGELVRSINGQ